MGHHARASGLDGRDPGVDAGHLAREGAGHGGAHALGARGLAPGEERGPGARDGAAERARRERGGLDAVEAGHERAPLRLDDDVGEAGADEAEIVRIAAREEAREVRRLRDEGAAVDRGRQDPPRLARVDAHVGVGQHAADALGHRHPHRARRVAAEHQHEAPEQRGRDVVGVGRAARHGLALHGEGEQALGRERLVEQGVGGDDGGDGRRGAAAEARREGDALVDAGLEAEGQAERAPHGLEGHAGGVALGLERQRGLGAADGRDAHARLGRAAHRDVVAEGRDGVAEHVEADGDVADGGGGEGARFEGGAHARCAPR
ncbi:MAG TPA: hypothetical protein VFS43_31485 [Polyangiaceae bacterium]|nr:hypothetical protein [Polyangiaceae bacterium]